MTNHHPGLPPIDDADQFQEEIVLPLGDILQAEFGDAFVNIAVGDHQNILVYVNERTAEIRSSAQAFVGDRATIMVRTTRYSNEELKRVWYQIEEALIDQGLDVMGAIRPGEIHISVSDVAAARQTVSALDLPDDIAITYEEGGQGGDLG